MEHQGNFLTTLAFIAWIPVALWAMRRWPPAKATAWLLFGGVMFLPEEVGFDLPGLPEFGKQQIALTWILISGFVFHRKRLLSPELPRTAIILLAMTAVGIPITVLMNQDPLKFGPTIVPGHGPYDIVHQSIGAFYIVLAPFLIAVAMFRSSADLRIFFRILVGGALVYSVFQLFELRFSPQLHRWVYGFHQSEFLQSMRKGGFRPMVFMRHGLSVAMLTASAAFAAAAMHRAKLKAYRFRAGWVALYLWLLLVVSKSIASFLYSLVAMPMILFTSPKTQVRIAALLAVVFFAYPLARSVGLVPVDQIRDVVTERYGEDRAESVMTRFDNEEMLLERASERLTFGWGSFCRGCTWDAWDGELESVRDGDWIIMLGDWGLVGYFGKFGLMLFPIFFLRRRLKRVPRQSDRRLLAGLALIVAFSVLDLLPNGNFNYLSLVYSGVLLGCTIGILREAEVLKRTRQQRRVAAREETNAVQRGVHAG